MIVQSRIKGRVSGNESPYERWSCVKSHGNTTLCDTVINTDIPSVSYNHCVTRRVTMHSLMPRGYAPSVATLSHSVCSVLPYPKFPTQGAAMMVAAEWASQGQRIDPTIMPSVSPPLATCHRGQARSQPYADLGSRLLDTSYATACWSLPFFIHYFASPLLLACHSRSHLRSLALCLLSPLSPLSPLSIDPILDPHSHLVIVSTPAMHIIARCNHNSSLSLPLPCTLLHDAIVCRPCSPSDDACEFGC